MRPRAGLVRGVILAMSLLASPVLAAERELDEDTSPSSASEIETPIERVFPEEEVREPLFPGLRQRLQKLPPFFADARLDARFRTYFLRQDRAIDVLSEAWAAGGSVSFRSGWLEDVLAVEAEGFTSQRVWGPDERTGTLLLAPGQEPYSVVGILNAKLRYKGVLLTGFRQYLDLPYVNRRDNRMTPNTFESITLAKPDGRLRFSAGYSWKVKLRNSDRFVSFTEALGLSESRGLVHGGVVWDPSEHVHVGAIGAGVPDLFAGMYAELGIRGDLADGLEGRLDAQYTLQREVGDDLLGPMLDDSWNIGVRTSASYANAVLRLGFSITGRNAPIVSPYGTNPSYVDLMQRTFNRADERAILGSLSYDFSDLGADGLSGILNYVAAFNGEVLGVRGDSHEVNLTLDYRLKSGWLRSFWLRVRGSWLIDELAGRDGTDVRVILRYDFPIL